MNKYFLLIFALLFGLGLQAQSLVGINIDDLSDAQILSIYEQGKAQGYTIENGEEMAIINGLSADAALKFKKRLEDLLNPEIIESQNQINEPRNDFKEIELPEINDSKKIDTSNIFGHDYFNVDLGSFDKSNGAKAPGNYVLGSGDELTISIFGSSYFQQSFQVLQSF